MVNTNRKVYMDCLRIIACFLVIFCHGPGYFAYQNNPSPALTYFYLFFTMSGRICVPIFFMLTGALMFPRTTTYREILSKRIPRILSALLIFSLLYYLARNKNDFSSVSVYDFVKKVIIDDLAGAYWYLYAYMALLLFLPFMQRIAHHFSTADFLLLLFLRFIILGVIPIANHFLTQLGFPAFWYTPNFSVPFATEQFLFYPFIGYYLEHVFDFRRLSGKHLGCMTLVSCLCIAVASIVTYHQGITSGFTQDYVMTFDYILAIHFYVLVKYCFTKFQISDCHNILSLISSLTFGIYLMEPILKCLCKEEFFNILIPESYPVTNSVLWCLFTFALCGLITHFMKKIPVVKNLL